MFEQLREKLGKKPEVPPADEEIVGLIDVCVRDYQVLEDATDRFAKGSIVLDELKFLEDCLGMSQYSTGKKLESWGLWKKYEGADYPTIDEMIAIRETLIPSEENPQNLFNIDDYRRG